MNLKALHKLSVCFTILLTPIFLFGQWAVFRPVLEDTVGINSLTSVVGHDNIVWATGSKYFVDTFDFYNVEEEDIEYFQSLDAGKTWTSGTIPSSANMYVNNICGVSDQKAWVNGVDFDAQSKIFITTDGGTTWLPAMTDKYITPTSYLNGLVFIDSLTGLSFGDPAVSDDDSTYYFEIYRTIDGGNNWNRIPSANIPVPLQDEFGVATYFSFLNNDIWFSTVISNNAEYRDSRSFHSSDGGLTWAAEITDASYVSFVDAEHGLVKNIYNDLFRTSFDGGSTWQDGIVPVGYIASLVMIPASYYLLATTNENNLTGPFKTLLSKDRGNTWTELGEGDNAGFVVFLAAELGYAGGIQRPDRPTELYKYNGASLMGIFNGKNLEGEITLNQNPNNGIFDLDITQLNSNEMTFFIHDINGKLIHRRSEMVQKTDNKNFDISRVSPGIYSITVATAQGAKTIKFVKN